MRAGLLDKLISFRRPVRSSDGYGSSPTSKWEAVAENVPARVSYGRGSLGVQEGETVYRRALVFTIRYNGAVGEYQRISWEGRLYRITAIERYPQRGEMRIEAELVTQE